MDIVEKIFNSMFRQKGGASVEFIVAVPVLLLMGLGGMQTIFFYDAKTTLNYATFEAAREGAVTNAQTKNMRSELGVRLSPIFGGDGTASEAMQAMAESTLEVNNAIFTKIEVLNPTKEAFSDFGVKNNTNGKKEIPNDNLKFRSRKVGDTSGVSIQDANILKIQVTYGYKLNVPLIASILPAAMKWIDPANIAYYAAGRIPMTAVATVRMQSPAWQDNNASSSGGGSVGGAPPQTSDPGENQPPGGDDNPSNTDTDSNNSSGDSDAGSSDSSGNSSSNGSNGDGDNTDSADGGNTNGDDSTGDEASDNGESNQVTCETTWEDEAYSADKCSGHWYCFAKDIANNVKAAANVVWDFVTGVMAGLKDQAADLWNMITDPKILIKLAKQFIDDPKGTLMSIVEGLGNDVKKVLECGPKDIGRIIGQNINPMTPVKVISKLAKLSGDAKLVKYAEQLEKDIVCASFPADTLIWTQNGPLNNQSVSEGLLVKSRNETNFKNTEQKVLAVITRTADGYQQINTESGIVTATPEHPFWVQGKGWTKAKDIESEDPIATIDGDAVVFKNDYVKRQTRVYNFTINGTGTYFAGKIGAWVHNTHCEIDHQISTGKNKTLNNPEPNTVYYVDGRHRYTTDNLGRTTNVKTKISEKDLDTGIRNCYQQGKAGACGLPDDEGGHLVATKIGGPGEKINLVPQNMNLNRGEWKKMENEWAKRAANGENIEVEIEIIYDGDGVRPEKFIVNQVFDGEPQAPLVFLNQPSG